MDFNRKQETGLDKTAIKKTIGPLLLISFALLVFFFSAFIIVIFRTRSSNPNIMRNYVGRSYVEVHNELSRLQLKIKLETKRFPDKLDGIILYQSIAPGKQVEAGSKVFITVNIGTDRIKMPNLVGIPLDTARAKLKSILATDAYVSLKIGAITYVEAEEGQPTDTVIRQIPPANKRIDTNEKVYLLVTNPSVKDKSSQLNIKAEDLLGQSFPVVRQKLDKEKKKWQLTKTIPTKKKWQIGLIESAQLVDDTWQIQTYYRPTTRRQSSGYEKLKITITTAGKYKLVAHKIISNRSRALDPDSLKGKWNQWMAKEKESKKEIILNSEKEYSANSQLHTIFYRNEDWRVKLIDSTGKVQQTWEMRAEL